MLDNVTTSFGARCMYGALGTRKTKGGLPNDQLSESFASKMKVVTRVSVL